MYNYTVFSFMRYICGRGIVSPLTTGMYGDATTVCGLLIINRSPVGGKAALF